MATEKRIPRSYKSVDSEYKPAQERAIREGTSLAVIIEEVVYAYGDGASSINFTKPPKKYKKSK